MHERVRADSRTRGTSLPYFVIFPGCCVRTQGAAACVLICREDESAAMTRCRPCWTCDDGWGSCRGEARIRLRRFVVGVGLLLGGSCCDVHVL